MRRAVFLGPHRLEIEDAARPEPGRGEALLAIHSVGVCGSDIHGYAGVNSRRSAGMIMGHEATAVVTRLGPDTDGPAPGTLVAVNPVVGCGVCEWCLQGNDNLCESRRLYGCVPSLDGAFADEMVARVENLVPIAGPAAGSLGALAEPFAVGAHAVAIGPAVAGAAAVVIGGGPIGIGAALAARRAGASRVTIVEPNGARRATIEQLGLETFDPSAAEVPGSSFAVAYECVGHSVTLASALRAVPPHGTVVFVGLAEEEITIPATPLMVGERRIAGSSTYTMADFRGVADWLSSGEEDLTPVVELRVGLEDLPGVFERYAARTLDAIKTLVEF